MYLRLIHTVHTEILVLSGTLKQMAPEDEDVRLLMTIPGIGYYSALLIKSEIGNVDRFPDGEHLCSYAGLVPSVRSSGRYARHGSITKQGSRWLRWIMVEAAHAHAKHETSISGFYHSLAQRKGKQIASVATARKLLLLCSYSVLKNRRRYSDQAY
ncbi:MAG: IS110 family transposase [Nitrososphaerota archaeon]|jgi:transposase|nr:IS110 family transposase [Nitrososphaerota archaeon]